MLQQNATQWLRCFIQFIWFVYNLQRLKKRNYFQQESRIPYSQSDSRFSDNLDAVFQPVCTKFIRENEPMSKTPVWIIKCHDDIERYQHAKIQKTVK